MEKQVQVHTDHLLTTEEIQKIRDIMRQSKCPNESLIQSLADCRGMNEDGIIVFGDAPEIKEVIPY